MRFECQQDREFVVVGGDGGRLTDQRRQLGFGGGVLGIVALLKRDPTGDERQHQCRAHPNDQPSKAPHLPLLGVQYGRCGRA